MNEGLLRGLDIFNDGPNLRGLSAGPQEQFWFHKAVLSASLGFSDSRLEPMRARLAQEIDRFRTVAGLPQGDAERQ